MTVVVNFKISEIEREAWRVAADGESLHGWGRRALNAEADRVLAERRRVDAEVTERRRLVDVAQGHY